MGNLHYFELIHNELVLFSESNDIQKFEIDLKNKRKILKLIFKSHHLLSSKHKDFNQKVIFFQYLDSFIQELKKEFR